jgi:uncharacterized tellurite resistance protein B-like protein
VLTKLLELFDQTPPATADTVGAPFARRDVAVVALLLEAAQIDGDPAPAELEAMARIVRDRFGLDAAIAATMIATAQSQLAASLEDWIFADAVRDGYTAEEREEILGLLWEVVYTDGRLVRFEQVLLDRMGKELNVDEAGREAARVQAFARSGRSAGGGVE